VPAAVSGGRLRPLLTRAAATPLVRAVRGQALTAPGGVLVALLVLFPGVLVDAVTDQAFGRPSTISALLAGAAGALTVRRSALGTAAALPPLLCAASIGLLAWVSGQNQGTRQLMLDSATTLALSAPAVFAATVLTLVLVLGRLAWSLVAR